MPHASNKDAIAMGLPVKAKRSKYGNRRCEADGLKFDSLREREQYGQLKLAKASGLVKWFIRQPSFDLPGGIVYRADFLVCYEVDSGGPEANGERVEVQDSKGFATKEYRLKKKLMLAVWGIEIREV